VSFQDSTTHIARFSALIISSLYASNIILGINTHTHKILSTHSNQSKCTSHQFSFVLSTSSLKVVVSNSFLIIDFNFHSFSSLKVTHDFSNFDLKKLNNFLFILLDNNSFISLKSGSLIIFKITQLFFKSSIPNFFHDLIFLVNSLKSSVLIYDH
jgi:hypothetical protein